MTPENKLINNFPCPLSNLSKDNKLSYSQLLHILSIIHYRILESTILFVFSFMINENIGLTRNLDSFSNEIKKKLN